MEHKRLTLFAGHYGSGKTNIAVYYALKLAAEGKNTCIADLDIVNRAEWESLDSSSLSPSTSDQGLVPGL